MVENEKTPSDETWKKFLKRHWKMTLLIAGGIIGAVVTAILVFLWVVADAQAVGGFPAVLGEWTVGYCISFFFRTLLWELLLVATWVIAGAVIIYFLWYKNLPTEERVEYEGEPKKKRSRNGGGAISILIIITWLIIVAIDGRWNLAFQSWTFNDWIYSFLAAALWDLIIFGIPVTIGLIWWLRREIKTEP